MHQFENLHAERAIVASILQHPDCLIDLDNSIDLTAFKNPANRAIVQLALQLYNGGYTRFEKELLRNKITLVPVPGIEVHQMQEYVSALMSAETATVNFNNYVNELREAHLKESLNKLLNEVIGSIKDGSAPKLLGDLQTRLYELSSGNTGEQEPVDVSKSIRQTIEQLVVSPEIGIPSGIDVLDAATMGWIGGKFYFVGARPGTGKSAFLLQCASHAAFFAPKDRRASVLYMDSEMNEKEFKIRLVGHLAGVDTKRIQAGLWQQDPREKENVEKALYFVEKIGGVYYYHMPGYSLSRTVNVIKKYVYNYGVKLVLFDQIEEPEDADKDRKTYERISLVGRTLKHQCQLLDIPILAALQLNKEGEEKSRVSSRAYAHTDGIYQKADGAFALTAKSANEIQKETIQAGTHRFQILKGRYCGNLYSGINLRYIKYCLRFWPAQIQFTEQVEQDHANDEVSEQTGIPHATEFPTGPLVS